MIFKHNCLVNGHRYTPRYDEFPIYKENVLGNLVRARASVDGMEAFRRMTIRNVYVCDICTKCGNVIKRKENE